MYCIGCGSQNTGRKYCRDCGTALPELGRTTSEPIALRRLPSETEVLRETLRHAPPQDCCYRCGATADLTSHDFAIAKITSVKRDWSETLVRLGASAVSVALASLIGGAMVSWKSPDKRTTYSIVRATLVLCRPCLSQEWNSAVGMPLKSETYRYHRWTNALRSIGYDQLLSVDELARLRPSSGNGR